MCPAFLPRVRTGLSTVPGSALGSWLKQIPLRSTRPRSGITPRPQLCSSAASDNHVARPAASSVQRPSAINYSALLKVARLHNMVPSLLLVLLGAWAGAGRSLAALCNISVWMTSLMSCGVAVASVVINDYFDFAAGVDSVNAPHKPIPSGSLAPDAAVLFSSLTYCAVLCCACCMEPPWLRAIVAFSAGVTLLYTPFFKKVTTVKNATVASVIALTPVAGALAAGADMATLMRLAPSIIFAFVGVMYREILMDVNDVAGDAAAGIVTLPVMVGPAPALALAAAGLVGGSTVSVLGLLSWAGAAGGGVTMLQCVACSLVLMAMLQVMVQVSEVFRSDFDAKEVSQAIDGCLQPIGLAMIILAASC